MHCYLLDLPAELQLKMIDELLRDETINTHDRHGYSHEEKQDEPICIYHDLINWSCTCSYFRNLLAPDIFKTTRLVNDEKSGCSLNAVAKSPHSVHVKSLHFIGSTDKAMFPDTEGILPHSVDTLICDLQRFPSLEKLSISFDSLEGYDEWLLGEEFDGEDETPAEVLEAEASEAWRALMSRTYFALTKNKSPRFKHLEIRQLIWKNVSTFSNAAFHDFLGHFEQFTLSIYGDEPYMGFQELASRSNGNREDFALMGKLDKYFFSQLVNVTTFSIKAPKKGPLGLEKTKYYAPLVLKADQLPLLKLLHLDHVCACPQLIDFLVGHKYTLEELTLRNCSASNGTGDVSWSQLFTSLFSAYPAQLRRFELVRHKIHLIRRESWEGEENEWEVPDKIREARTILRQDPTRRLFAYTFLNYRTGELLYDQRKILTSFWLGQDQESWDRLMGLVEENNRNAKSRLGVLV